MRGADASAGTIKSGGKTRRAAKMVILDVDHPDVEEFIWCKAQEEKKAHALRDAGFDMGLDGKDIHSIQYQNANNSVRISDDFMNAVLTDADWNLVGRSTGQPVRTLKARQLWREIAQAAWECADPGLQFDTTINKWHTSSNTDRINGSNPCSEYMHIDNSACNLASINLMKFLSPDDSVDVEAYKAAIEVLFTAQEIIVGNGDYPTKLIGENSHKFRQLGIGYANIGALLNALFGNATELIVMLSAVSNGLARARARASLLCAACALAQPPCPPLLARPQRLAPVAAAGRAAPGGAVRGQVPGRHRTVPRAYAGGAGWVRVAVQCT
jgi:ribonucleoside-diphosphate reductase alpha chain